MSGDDTCRIVCAVSDCGAGLRIQVEHVANLQGIWTCDHHREDPR